MSDLAAQPEKPAPILATLTCTTCNVSARADLAAETAEIERRGADELRTTGKISAETMAAYERNQKAWMELNDAESVELEGDEEEGPGSRGW